MIRRIVFGLFLIVASGAWAEIDRLVVFGDSLSDTGNVNSLTFGIVPSDDYHNSSVFSNGAPWIQFLAEGIGVGVPDHSRASTANATNYAYGGAKSGGGGASFASVVVRNVSEQIDEFIADGRSLDENTLVVLWIGGNDLNGTSAAGASSQINRSITNVESHLLELISLGARQLLVPNVPLLGEVPQHNGILSERNQQNQLTSDYNEALEQLLVTLELAHSEVRFIRNDVVAAFNDVQVDPEAFGFTNILDQAYTPGFLGGSLGSSTVASPDEYVFWDDLHPTGGIHRLIGERAAAKVNTLPLPAINPVGVEDGVAVLSFSSKSWATYQVERSSNLIDWVTVGAEIAGTGSVVEVSDVDQPLIVTEVYYRVKMQ